MTGTDLNIAPPRRSDRPVAESALVSASVSRRRTAHALAAWTILVALGVLVVYHVLVAPGASRLDAAPLHAAVDPRIEIWIVLPIAFGIVAARGAISVAASISWRWLLVTSWAFATAWTVSLAATRGWGRLTSQLQRPGEYLAVVPEIDSLTGFLDTFVESIRAFPVHVQGHPPGFVVVAWTMRQIGLGGPLPVSVLCIAVGAAAVPAVLIVIRETAGHGWARRAAPFVAVSPAAIWVATSADAFYAGVGAAAVAVVVLAIRRVGPSSDAYALAGGALFAMTAFLSYGLVLLAALPLVIAVHRRRVRPIVLAVVGATPVFVAFAAAGFWWIDGLFATGGRYFAGIASRRPYEVFILANLSSFAIALGPAIAVALGRLRDSRMWLVVGGALFAVALADLSGMSKSEVERIWLPFAPFVLASGAALTGPAPARRAGLLGLSVGGGWLAIQATAAILLESLVRTGW